MMEGIGHHGMSMPLSATEFAYSIVQQASSDPDLTPAPESDLFLEPTWAQGSLSTTDSLDLVFPSDEVILEELIVPDRPWDDLHHRSYVLPELGRIEAGEFVLTMTGDRYCPINPLAMHIVYAEGSMETYWLWSLIIFLIQRSCVFQPCSYPMKTLYPRSMYTLPSEGVQRGGLDGGSRAKPSNEKIPCKCIL
jgi:hypothetical protein